MVSTFNITAPPKQLAYEAKIIEAGRNDLISFGKLFLPGDFKKTKTPFFHTEIASAYVNHSIRQLAVIIARGHGKTVLTKAFLLHTILYYKKEDGPPPLMAWIADTIDKVYNNMDYIDKQIRFNPRIRRYFGDLSGKKRGLKWSEHYKEFINGIALISRSNTKGVRGESKGNLLGGSERFHLIVLDDIENEKNTISYEAREYIKREVTNAIFPALEPNIGRLIFNGTPVHNDSLCQNILDGWRKAVRDHTEHTYSWKVIAYSATQPSMPGGVLWPDYFPKNRLEERRKFYIDTVGSDAGYYQEYELKVVSDATRIWSRDHYKIHNTTYYYDDELQHSFLLTETGVKIPVNCFIGSDPATDITTNDSDDSVILVIAVDEHSNIYVLDYIAENNIREVGIYDKDGTLIGKKGVTENLVEVYDMYHCINGTLEDVAMTRGVWNNIDAYKAKFNRYDIVLIPEYPQGREKLSKIQAGLSPFFSQRKIFLREEMYELREQIESFGKHMSHDDIIESLFFATRNMQPPKGLTYKNGVYKRKHRIFGSRRSWTTL